MPELRGLLDGVGTVYEPLLPALSLYSDGGVMTNRGAIALSVATNGKPTIAGMQNETVLGTAKALIVMVPDENEANKLFEKVHSEYKKRLESKTFDVPPERADAIGPAPEYGKLVFWESMDYIRALFTEEDWVFLLSSIQEHITISYKPQVPEHGILGMGRAIYGKSIEVIQRDGQAMRPGPELHWGGGYKAAIIAKTYPLLPAEEKAAVPYIGLLAKILEHVFTNGKKVGDKPTVTGYTWKDWCALAHLFMYMYNPGGTIKKDRILSASDMLTKVFSYLGIGYAECYRKQKLPRDFLLLAIGLCFACERQGNTFVDLELWNMQKQSPWIARNTLATYLDRYTTYADYGSGGDLWFPSLSNTARKDAIPFPVFMDIHKPGGYCEINITPTRNWLKPSTLEIRRNEANTSLEVPVGQEKAYRIVTPSDVRVTAVTHEEFNRYYIVRWPVSTYNPESMAELLMGMMSNGSNTFRHGVAIPTSNVTPYIRVSLVDMDTQQAIEKIVNIDTGDVINGAKAIPGYATRDLILEEQTEREVPGPQRPTTAVLPPTTQDVVVVESTEGK